MNNPVALIQQQIAESGLFVLDGGLGSELERRGNDISSTLWSADLIINNPAALLEVHLAYLQAGARCITTASYQASIAGLQSLGYDEAQAKDIMLQSVSIAQQAINQFVSAHPDLHYRPLIAASIGPYGAALADGSEYRGNYGLSIEALKAFHHKRLQWMDQSSADLIAIETIPDLTEARALAELLVDIETPTWISFCCADGSHLHDGHLLSDAAALFVDLPAVMGVGINCTAPRYIDALITVLKTVVEDKLIVVYPNSGADYDARLKCWTGQETAEEFAELARHWRATGASMIGGCCRIGPQQIAALCAPQ